MGEVISQFVATAGQVNHHKLKLKEGLHQKKRHRSKCISGGSRHVRLATHCTAAMLSQRQRTRRHRPTHVAQASSTANGSLKEM